MKFYVSFALAVTLVLGMSGCSDDEESSGSDEIAVFSLPAKNIDTVDDAKNASAVAGDSQNTGGIGGLSSSRSSAVVRAAQAPVLMKASQTFECEVGGNIVYDIDENENGTFSYNNCDDGRTISNGSGTVADDVVTMNITITQKSDGSTFSGNYRIKFTEDALFDTMAIYGNITIKESGMTSKYGYDNLALAEQTNGNGMKINGKVSVELSQYSCINGSYTYTTEEMLIDNGQYLESGVVDINGVAYSFFIDNNGIGKITVEFPDGTTETINQNQAIVCN